MARYYLHLCDSVFETRDTEGIDCTDLDLVRSEVLRNARDLLAGDAQRGAVDLGCRINAENEEGEVVYSLPLRQAVAITRGEA
jgi:hypothetical protein